MGTAVSAPRAYPDIAAEVTGRAETHRIAYGLALPAVKVSLDGWRHPIYVHTARLTFTSRVDDRGARWLAEMAIGGRFTAEGDDVHAALRYDPCNGVPGYEAWPEPLALIADQLHPDRPGGWPGTDPEGSYL